MTTILLGETDDLKRELIFALVDRTDSDQRVAGHVFVLGEIKLRTPGAAIADVATVRINTLGGGHYSVYLTDSEVELAGSGFLEIDETLTAAIPNTITFEISDAADFAGSGGGDGGDDPVTLLPAGLVTLASIREIVRLRGDYLSSLTFDDDYINKEIQAGWGELYELMDDSNEGWWDTEGNVTTVASQAYIALPSNCWRVKGVDILDGSEYTELRQLPIGYRNKSAQTARPNAFRLSARGVELTPIPAAAYTIRVTYAPICPALDEDGGIELYGWQEFVIEAALLRLDKREERPTGERWQTLYAPGDGLKARIIRGSSKRKQQEPDYLLMREGTYGSYEDPF